MSGIITTGNHPKALWPGVKAWFGVNYSQREKIWPKLFESMDSNQQYEEIVEATGFGLMSVKPQTQSISYDTASQGYSARFVNTTYALGYIVSMEELQDNLYEKVSMSRSARLARSVFDTEETVHANTFNRATSASYTGGDGVAMLSTAHPTMNGTQSNKLATAADLSEASIEDMAIMVMNATDSRGLKINLKPRKLAIANENSFEAERILSSTLQNDTANNAVNVLKARGIFPEGIVTNPYFTDPDAWFILTDAPEGLIHFTRMAATFDKDNDFDTKSAKASVVARWANGWADWRGVYGTDGA